MSNTEFRFSSSGAVSKVSVLLTGLDHVPPATEYVLHNEDEMARHLLALLDRDRIKPGVVSIIDIDTGRIKYVTQSYIANSQCLCGRLQLRDYYRVIRADPADAIIVVQTSMSPALPAVYVVKDVASIPVPEKPFPHENIVRALTFRACVNIDAVPTDFLAQKSEERRALYTTEVQKANHGRSYICARYLALKSDLHITVTREWETV